MLSGKFLSPDGRIAAAGRPEAPPQPACVEASFTTTSVLREGSITHTLHMISPAGYISVRSMYVCMYTSSHRRAWHQQPQPATQPNDPPKLNLPRKLYDMGHIMSSGRAQPRKGGAAAGSKQQVGGYVENLVRAQKSMPSNIPQGHSNIPQGLISEERKGDGADIANTSCTHWFYFVSSFES